MKTQKSLNGHTASGFKLNIGEIFYEKPSTGNTYFRDAPAVIRFNQYASDANEHNFSVIPQWASDDDSVALFGTSNAVKFKRVVDTISASGKGLPTEDAVVNFVNANKGAKMSFQASVGSNIEFAVPHNATHIIYSGIPFTVVINSISYSNVHILFKFGPNAYAAPAVMIKSDGSVSARTGSSFTTLKCSSGSGTGNYIYKVSFEN